MGIPDRVLRHEPQQADITSRIALIMQPHCYRGFAVTSSAPEFLQIVLNGGRVLPVNDHADIFDIETHTERACAYDPIHLQADLSPEKPLEKLLSFPGVAELRVIERDFQS